MATTYPVKAEAVPKMGVRDPAPATSSLSLGQFLGLLPLLITMPLIYWPRLLEVDTQPWVIGGAAFAAVFFWKQRVSPRTDALWPVTLLALLSIAGYALRGPEFNLMVRYAAVLATFVTLWHVASRGPGPVVGTVVRVTVALWFIVAVYQVVAIRTGLPVEFFGRYQPGRSGVPSLTAEPSFFGSISVLHLMYLVTEQRRKNRPFIILAVINVVLSGSALSFILLVVPLLRMPLHYKILGGLLGVAALLFGIDFMQTGFFERFRTFDISRIGVDSLADASTNLRAGHVWFTFVELLPRELVYGNYVDFFLEYNAWARSTGLFIDNGSDFILPSGGELLFRSGIAGLLLIILMIRTAWKSGVSRYERWEKAGFVALCFLNPISMMNPYFIFYIHQRFQQKS
jgi:hypothetical protein